MQLKQEATRAASICSIVAAGFYTPLSWVYIACPNQDEVLSYRLTLASKSPDLQKSFESTKYVRLLRMMNK